MEEPARTVIRRVFATNGQPFRQNTKPMTTNSTPPARNQSSKLHSLNVMAALSAFFAIAASLNAGAITMVNLPINPTDVATDITTNNPQ